MQVNHDHLPPLQVLTQGSMITCALFYPSLGASLATVVYELTHSKHSRVDFIYWPYANPDPDPNNIYLKRT